jgi:hypothetical protein
MLKPPLLAIVLLASGLGAGTGLAQQIDTFTFVPQTDNLTCAPPYGPAANTPPMSRQDTVEQVVGAGQTASLCLTRDSSVTVSAVHCRRTESAGDTSPGMAGGPQSAEAAPTGDAPAQPGPGAGGQRGGAGAAAGGGNDMTKTWTCPSGTPCFGDGGFLPGARQALMDPGRARFCVRYLNAGQTSHIVRADFAFSYPAR